MSTFTLTPKEIERVEEYKKSLKHLFGEAKIEYRFTEGGGIGTIVKIYCEDIDKEYDITDFDSW